MAKRFTDTTKWRNEWFRTLPTKAKLAWIYICDECDYSGIWQADWGLASFQLDFKLTPGDLADWFGDKVYFFGDRVLLVPFFKFQYGASKDTWSVKIKATERLENFGFSVENNTTVVPLSPHCVGVVLYKGNTSSSSKNLVSSNTRDVDEAYKPDLEAAYKLYPRKSGKSAGLKSLAKQIKTPEDYQNLVLAIERYSKEVAGRDAEHIKMFSSFSNGFWKDCLDPDYGSAGSIRITTGYKETSNDV